jgi:hypothetical protein
MVATINTRWTLKKMAEARTLFESGASFTAIVAKCGGTEASVKTIARMNGWRRPPRYATPDGERLAKTIKGYWAKRGRDIEISINGGQIRSNTVNGIPA